MASHEEFEHVLAEVRASGPPSDGDNLLGMQIDADAYLGRSAGLWEAVSVQRSEGSEWLIDGRASGIAEDAERIADALTRLWEDHLRYGYRAAHTVAVATDSVTLRAVTQISDGGIWVTARIRVSLS